MNIVISLATEELCLSLDDEGLGVCEASIKEIHSFVSADVARRLRRMPSGKRAKVAVVRNDETGSMHEVRIQMEDGGVYGMRDALVDGRSKMRTLLHRVDDMLDDAVESALEALHAASQTTEDFHAHEQHLVSMLASAREDASAFEQQMGLFVMSLNDGEDDSEDAQ